MERDTKTITTPNGITVVLYSYLIGREKRALTNVFLGKNLSFTLEGGVSGLDAATLTAAQELAWNTVIVSIDGKKASDEGFSIVDAVLNMRSEDYQAVVAAVNEITNDADFAKKKAS